MSHTQDKNAARFHKNTGIDNNALYLHLKHRYGWLKEFSFIYQAFTTRLNDEGKDRSFKRMERLFGFYLKEMKLEVEFKKHVIDDRRFNIQISTNDEMEYEQWTDLSAGQILDTFVQYKMIINLISYEGFKECTIVLGDDTYTITKIEE